jgi:hypothetical protein
MKNQRAPLVPDPSDRTLHPDVLPALRLPTRRIRGRTVPGAAASAGPDPGEDAEVEADACRR